MADEVIVTATTKAVDLIEFTNPLPYWKQMALSNLVYLNAARVHILIILLFLFIVWNSNKLLIGALKITTRHTWNTVFSTVITVQINIQQGY